jgi:hypothetical protein
VTEVSTKAIVHELREARATISHLTTQHARSVGWESRLSAVLKEKDDMQQERDSESNRAKLAESRLAAMRDKTSLLKILGLFNANLVVSEITVGDRAASGSIRRAKITQTGILRVGTARRSHAFGSILQLGKLSSPTGLDIFVSNSDQLATRPNSYDRANCSGQCARVAS